MDVGLRVCVDMRVDVCVCAHVCVNLESRVWIRTYWEGVRVCKVWVEVCIYVYTCVLMCVHVCGYGRK